MRKTIAVSIISLSLMLSPIIANAAVSPTYYQHHYYTYYLYNLISKYQLINTGTNGNGNTNTVPPSGNNNSSGTSTTPSGSSTAPSGTSGGTMYSYTLSSDESYLASLVNQERSKSNLKSLTINTDLSYVAHLKAEDMLKNNYFSHTSPTYGSPFDMMSQFGIKYTMAGENIAENTSVLNAHNAFMNSSGHRANILNAGYTDVGIGIVKMPNGGIIAVEMFIAK